MPNTGLVTSMSGNFTETQDGIWCNACGELIAAGWQLVEEPDIEPPKQCPRCGWPDEFDPAAAGFVDEGE
ncbi:MAG: hypothetical protein ACR2PA_05985 [Hyphomicrobiaceae bacterium]